MWYIQNVQLKLGSNLWHQWLWMLLDSIFCIWFSSNCKLKTRYAVEKHSLVSLRVCSKAAIMTRYWLYDPMPNTSFVAYKLMLINWEVSRARHIVLHCPSVCLGQMSMAHRFMFFFVFFFVISPKGFWHRLATTGRLKHPP